MENWHKLMESPTMSPSKRKKTKKESEVDYFNMLPDDIICSILSRLTMAEAVRSSVLCVRWRYLWTYFASLDFDASFALNKLVWSLGTDRAKRVYQLIDLRERFRRWVDQVLKSLGTQTMESLRIHFDLENDSHVDKWVRFAIQKKVKKLDLDLLNSRLNHNQYHEYCVVPSLLKLSTLPCLQVLRLSCVDVSAEDLEYLLSSCPFLEILAVTYSESIVNFKVSSHSKLKQLEIISCSNLKTLEISAQNLVSFTCVTGSKVPIINYKHIPNLKEVSFGGLQGEVVFSNYLQLTTYNHSSCLKVLKLTTAFHIQCEFQLPKKLVLATLQYLELYAYWLEEKECNLFISLMNRCHSFCEFTLKILSQRSPQLPNFRTKQEHAYNCLEEVKVVGFHGNSAEVEFIGYRIKNAPNLKKLIIDQFSHIIWESLLRTKLENLEIIP